MRAFEQGLNVVQNNVSNSQTPGYAKQSLLFIAENLDINRGLPGGVSIGGLVSSRDEYAEQAVRRQQSAAGQADQRVSDLSQIEPIFDLVAGAGVAGALDKFFQGFSQLSVAPNSVPARQIVLDRAEAVAQAINQSASGLNNASSATDGEISNTVASINNLLARIADYNSAARQTFDANKDPSLDAGLHQTLEQLSELVDFTAIKAENGTTTILIGGQTSAVIGDHVYPLHVQVSGTQAQIMNAENEDISGQIDAGRIPALLKTRNETIPSYLNDLNSLATAFADRVNSILGGGLDINGNVPATPLFTYDATNGAAFTLSVNALDPGDIAAASMTAPGGNGNSLALADLTKSKEINGFTFTEFYGNLGGRVGRDLASARDDQQSRGALLAQAQSLRSAASGVSLDEEAAKLIGFQKSYQAAAQLISVLNTLTDSLMGILR
jgi:flagellar hook-associated protein 1 FlgK